MLDNHELLSTEDSIWSQTVGLFSILCDFMSLDTIEI